MGGIIAGVFSLIFFGAIIYMVYGLFRKEARKSYLRRGGLAAVVSFVCVGVFASPTGEENEYPRIETIVNDHPKLEDGSGYFDLGEISVPEVSTNSKPNFRWCDTMIPLMPELDPIIEFKRKTDGSFIAAASHPDSSVREQKLTKAGDIWGTQNSHGEYYKITRSGDLEIYDDQGIIRTIPPVTQLAKPGNCRNNTLE